jgi:plasmid stabilization system protein ParE
MYQVVITDPAENDIETAYRWWRDNRSAEQATRWYRQLIPAIATLREMPDRCPFAAEMGIHPLGLRELHFGIGRRPTHRIIFTIEEFVVTIIRVRHAAQRDLRLEDLT